MSIIITLVYSLVSMLCGVFLLRTLFKSSRNNFLLSPATFCAIAFILGQGVLANTWLAMGLLAIFSKYFIWTTLILTATLGVFYVKDIPTCLWRQAKNYCRGVINIPFWFHVITFLVIILVAAYCAKALTNLRLWEDGEAFYFVLPKVMAASERLLPQRNMYANFTQIGLSGEMHYAALMAISGEMAAKLYVCITAIAIMILISALCTQLGANAMGKIISVAAMFTTTAFTLWIYGGKVELFATAFGVAALFWAISTFKEPNLTDFAITGVFTGMAIISKLSYIPTLLPSIVVIVFWSIYSKTPRIARSNRVHAFLVLKIGLIFGAFALLPILPNIAKNYYLFREPLALFILFNSKASNIFTQAWYSIEDTRHILLTYPLALVFGKYPMMGGNISPLILLGMVLSFLIVFKSAVQKEVAILLAVAGATGLGAWVLVAPSVLSPRYLLPTLLTLIPISSLALGQLFENKLNLALDALRILSYCLVVVFLGISLYLVTKAVYWDLRSITGRESIDVPKGVYFPAQAYVNEHAASGDRVFVDGYLTYYLRADLLQCMNGEGDLDDENKLLKYDINKLLEHLVGRGIRYIIIQKNISFVFRNFDMNAEGVGEGLRQVFDDGNSAVYLLSPKIPAALPRWICKKNRSRAWEVIEML